MYESPIDYLDELMMEEDTLKIIKDNCNHRFGVCMLQVSKQ